MSFAANPTDQIRTYFEDSGTEGPPVLFYTGFADPLEVAKASRLARAPGGEFRLIYADHRGQGGSDKPNDEARTGCRQECVTPRSGTRTSPVDDVPRLDEGRSLRTEETAPSKPSRAGDRR